MGTGSRDEFQEAGTSLTRAVQYHGAALERAWWELVGTRVEGPELGYQLSTIDTFAEQTHTQTPTPTQTQTQTQTQLRTQAVDTQTPVSVTTCSGRLHRSLGGCQRSSSAMLVHARHACTLARLRLLHQSRLRLPSPWFPSLLHMPTLCQFQNPNWRPAREPRLGLDAVHALHPSILHVPLLPCHRDRSGALCLTRLPARQLCPLTPRS
jgi:hypothetical protein